MYNILVRWKNKDKLEEYENIDSYQSNFDGKYLCLYADSHTWFILHENILWFTIDYIGRKK